MERTHSRVSAAEEVDRGSGACNATTSQRLIHPHGLQLAASAEHHPRDPREDLACINTLIDHGDVDAAIASLRDLIDNTKDKNTKEQLAQQLANLRRTP